MFLRGKQNKSGSISIQILQKQGRKNVLLETIGCSEDKDKLDQIIQKGINA